MTRTVEVDTQEGIIRDLLQRVSTLESTVITLQQSNNDALNAGTVGGAGLVTIVSTSSIGVAAGAVWVASPSGLLVRSTPQALVLGGIQPAVNTRLDEVVIDYTGIASVLAGADQPGVTLTNRTGAATVPTTSILVADLLVNTGGVTSMADRRVNAVSGNTVGAFSAVKNAVQSIAYNTVTPIAGNFTEVLDTSSWFDPTAGTYTPQERGVYGLFAYVQYAAPGSADALDAFILKNSSSVGAAQIGGGSVAAGQGASMLAVINANGTTDSFQAGAYWWNAAGVPASRNIDQNTRFMGWQIGQTP